MVAQVRVVAILIIVHGGLLLLMGGYYTYMGVSLMMLPPGAAGPGPGGNAFIDLFSGAMLAIGIGVVLLSVLHVVSGVRLLMFKNRILAICTLFSSVLGWITCYCAPTSIALMIYGLIILFQRDVGQAFEMVANGKATDDVLRHFARRKSYGDERDDFDDRPGRYGEDRNVRRYDEDEDDDASYRRRRRDDDDR